MNRRERTSTKQKCKTVPNRNHGAAEQNKQTKKHLEVQQQTSRQGRWVGNQSAVEQWQLTQSEQKENEKSETKGQHEADSHPHPDVPVEEKRDRNLT